MPDSFSDILDDLLVPDDVALLRYQAEIAREADREIIALAAVVIPELRAIDPSEPTRTAARSNRVRQVVERITTPIRSAYRSINRNTRREWRGQAEAVTEMTRARVNRALPDTLRQVVDVRPTSVALFNRQVDIAVLRGIGSSVIVQGQTAPQWWLAYGNELGPRLAREYMEALRGNAPLSNLVERTDTIFRRARREARTVVQTTSNAVTNASRLALYEQHRDVLRGIQWRSVLDSRTSDICIAFSGHAWTLDGQIIEGRIRYPGPPPAHWGCRSTIIPIFQAWRRLIRRRRRVRQQLGELPSEGTRLVDGQLARRGNFETFLQRQSVARQNEILGVGKARLWREGKIGLTDLIDQSRRPLTLEELQEMI